MTISTLLMNDYGHIPPTSKLFLQLKLYISRSFGRSFDNFWSSYCRPFKFGMQLQRNNLQLFVTICSPYPLPPHPPPPQFLELFLTLIFKSPSLGEWYIFWKLMTPGSYATWSAFWLRPRDFFEKKDFFPYLLGLGPRTYNFFFLIATCPRLQDLYFFSSVTTCPWSRT